MATTATLGIVDYLIIAIMLAISIGIGLYYRYTGGRQKTMEEYFAANRSMGIIPVGIALMVSFMSAITLLGVSSENYVYGSQFVVINISYLLGTPLVCYGYLPVFYKLQGTSVYEYLEKRFGVYTRLLASLILWIQLLLYSGVVLYAPAIAFEATTGLSKTASIFTIGLACAFYSSIGGIKAVLITDVFQASLMFISLLLVIGTAASDVGGIGEIWRIAEEGGRLDIYNFSPDPTVRHTWWGLIIGGMCTFLSLYAVNQVQVQRLLTVKSLRNARAALWINWPILTALSVVTCFSGLAIYSKYHECDPLKEKKITGADMLLPHYVMETMSGYPGLPGLFIAGIFSAGLSTVSAVLNSLSAITFADYIKPMYFKCTGEESDPRTMLIWSKIFAFIVGIASIAVAFLAEYLGGVLQASLTIFGIVGGPLLGLFTLGMLSRSANQRGAIIGTLTAIVFLLWVSFGQGPKPPTLETSTAKCDVALTLNETLLAIAPTTLIKDNITNWLHENHDDEFFYLYRISYLWYSPLGVLITMVIGWFASKISICLCNEEQMYLDPNLFFPCIEKRIREQQQPNLDMNGIPGSVRQNKYSFTPQEPVLEKIDASNL